MRVGKFKEEFIISGIIILFLISSFIQISTGYVETIADQEMSITSFKNYIFDRYYENQTFDLSEYGRHFYNWQSNIDFNTNKLINAEQTYSLIEEQMGSPWPMKCHDLHHTSRSPFRTVNTTGIEKWRFLTSGCIESAPIVGNDGIIYVGDFDDYLYAIYPNGTLKWKCKTGGWIWSAPAISADGTIYVTSYDAILHALHSNNGTLKWRIGGGGSISSSPAIDKDGTIFFGAMGPGNKGRISAINPNGTRKWVYDTGYWIVSDPAVGNDGTVYIGSSDTYLYALYPNGTLRWRFKTDDWIQGHPSIADDGIIYVPSFDGYLYAIYPNGTLRWKTTIGPGGDASSSIAQDGTLFIGSNKLYAIYPNGTKKWIVDLDGDMFDSSPAISLNGTIYIGAKNNLVAVDPDGNEQWRYQIGKCKSSPAIAEDGTIYVGSAQDDFGYLHAFGPVESNNPPDKPTISGEINGSVRTEYRYTFVTTDPDNNPVYYYIKWGDGTNEETRECASGEQVKVKHKYFIQGSYTIKAKAIDNLGEESDWAILEVTMPKGQNMWFKEWIEQFPLL